MARQLILKSITRFRLTKRLLELIGCLSMVRLIEVAVTAVISLLPLLAIGVLSMRTNTNAGIYEVLQAAILPLSKGQLFLFCFSTLASVLWLLWDVGHRILGVIVGPICLLMLIYTTLLMGDDPQMLTTTNPAIVNSSYFVYAISLLLHYIVLSAKDAPPPKLSASIDAGVKTLSEQVASLQEQEGVAR